MTKKLFLIQRPRVPHDLEQDSVVYSQGCVRRSVLRVQCVAPAEKKSLSADRFSRAAIRSRLAARSRAFAMRAIDVSRWTHTRFILRAFAAAAWSKPSSDPSHTKRATGATWRTATTFGNARSWRRHLCAGHRVAAADTPMRSTRGRRTRRLTHTMMEVLRMLAEL